jgi:hypothetical protein
MSRYSRAIMSWLAVVVAFNCPSWGQGNAELSNIQFIYLLPMTAGLEQYLANRLTAEQIYQVVIDHTKAEAVFTDQIGAAFEVKLAELYPPPKPEAEEKEKKAEEESNAGGLKGDTGTPPSTFRRGRGNLFLVDLKSRRVLWSIYYPPRSSAPADLDRASRRIVEDLRKAVRGK